LAIAWHVACEAIPVARVLAGVGDDAPGRTDPRASGHRSDVAFLELHELRLALEQPPALRHDDHRLAFLTQGAQLRDQAVEGLERALLGAPLDELHRDAL
jgi:hypothetical protein